MNLNRIPARVKEAKSRLRRRAQATRASWNAKNFPVGRIAGELSWAKASNINDVVWLVGADDLVGFAGGLGHRVFANAAADCGLRGAGPIDTGSL